MRTRHGLTLIELLVGLAVVAILVALVAPSLRDLIILQRLKSVNAEFVTDVQYARSEAVSRNQEIWIRFKVDPSGAMTCYTLFVFNSVGSCDCTRPPGSVCTLLQKEIRTTQVPSSTDVQIIPNPTTTEMKFQPSGMMDSSVDYLINVDRISGSRGALRTTVSPLGRPTVCSPDASITGVPATC